MNSKSICLKILHVFIGIMIAIVCFVIFSFTYIFTNGMTSGFKGFYVEYDNQVILQEGSFILPFDEESRFNVGYSLGFLNENKHKGYTLTISPKTTEFNEFLFTVDGQQYSYNYERELTPYFNIALKNSHFIINMDKDMQDILQSIYPSKQLELPDKSFHNVYYFSMRITSYDGQSTVIINFGYSPKETNNE